MEATATVRYIRMSPKKIRLMADLIRGKKVSAAQVQLMVASKDAAIPLLKLLKSVSANAEGKKMDAEKLFVKSIMVDGGPTLKRSRPRAFGRAAPIRKRTSHVTIVLAER